MKGVVVCSQPRTADVGAAILATTTAVDDAVVIDRSPALRLSAMIVDNA